MDIIIPDIEHKYITLFETQQGYDAAAPNFIEVNWSAVKDTEHPEETPVPYQPSTRPTHGYEPVDNVDVFPDSSVRMLWYTYDHIYKTFFLEIIWGYSGWEWVDYEYTDPDTQETTTLHGGNLYKVKEITEVPSIPDGYRLEHINNFLNSQDKVIHVCQFDTSNIKAMNRAFGRPWTDSRIFSDFSVPGRFKYYNSPEYRTATQIQIDITNFPKVTELTEAYMFRELLINQNTTLQFPVLKTMASSFRAAYIHTNNATFKIDAPNLEDISYAFSYTYLLGGELNVNELFSNKIKNLSNLNHAFYNTTRHCYDENEYSNNIYLDLTDTNLDPSVIIDARYCFASCRSYNNNSAPVINTGLDINFNNPINLDYAFMSCNFGDGINFHGKESLITSIEYGFSNKQWEYNFPFTQPLCLGIKDSNIFDYGTIYIEPSHPLVYNFSPTNVLITASEHFRNVCFVIKSSTMVNIDDVIQFSNIDKLDKVVMSCYFVVHPEGKQYGSGAIYNTINDDYTFPYILHDDNCNYTDKYREISLPFASSIVPQTIYTRSEYFGRDFKTIPNGLYIHYKSQINMSNCKWVESPELYIDSSEAKLTISGDLVETIHYTSGYNGVQTFTKDINFTASNLPNLVHLDFSGNLKTAGIYDVDFTGQYNIDTTDFESFINTFSFIRTLSIQQQFYDSLSSSCKTTMLNVCNNINLIQES